MPTSTLVAYIDRVPDEILLMILKLAMRNEYEFFPELCVQAIRSRRGGRLESEYKSAVRYFSLLQQSTHLNDWCIANRTSRRIRTMGREAFFSSKVFTVSSSFPNKLRNGTFSAFGNAFQQRLALRYIRYIVFEDAATTKPTLFLELPKIVHTLPQLASVVLWFGRGTSKTCRHIPEKDLKEFPMMLKQLFGDIGLASGAKLQVSLGYGLQWAEFEWGLGCYIYPRLRNRAALEAVKDPAWDTS
ncbi:hypothetical protein NUW58_g2433 [Xylaria curta]|uniref:Uncharacterized protein n=1 Tax=Xylaria curta TaxID=42375 RepID=A0ACC1PIU3_9PEZI|nr:hypothetical protein NUW58_g2433 [Xylaria curta]